MSSPIESIHVIDFGFVDASRVNVPANSKATPTASSSCFTASVAAFLRVVLVSPASVRTSMIAEESRKRTRRAVSVRWIGDSVSLKINLLPRTLKSSDVVFGLALAANSGFRDLSIHERWIVHLRPTSTTKLLRRCER